MTSREFAQLWYDEKEALVSEFMNTDSQSAVAATVVGLGLSPGQLQGLKRLIDHALTDTMYTLLLGLDGCASIGGQQETYGLFSPSGDQLSGDGRLEGAAWEVFYGASGHDA
jgi:hypothetical protein